MGLRIGCGATRQSNALELVAQMVLYQGTTSVVPHEAHKQRGFSP